MKRGRRLWLRERLLEDRRTGFGKARPGWCGIAAMASRAAAATAADAIDSIGPSRGEIARRPDAPSMSRITPTFSAES